MIRMALVVAMLLASPALAETLACSTWQGFTTCQSSSGYRSTEWSRPVLQAENQRVQLGRRITKADIDPRYHRHTLLFG